MFPQPPTPCVSIVVPTFNRFERLKRCLHRVKEGVSLPHEIVVVDGGSTDGTRPWLLECRGCRVIFEEKREGAVRAFNKGFRAAIGRYVMWLNDDAYPLPGAVEAAVALLERPDLPDLGMVAFYHTWHSPRNILDEVEREGRRFHLCHVRGYPYANFGLLRRELLQAVGYADEEFRFCGFDPDLALKIQLRQGLKVVGCPEALIVHDEHHDDRKVADLPQGDADNERLFKKWSLPAPGAYPDPRPAYRRLVRDRIGFRPTEGVAVQSCPAGGSL